MSVDIFMPVETAEGHAQKLSTWPWNRFGYGLEFDETGNLGKLRISFESVAALLLELDRQAHVNGLQIQRIIITPEFVPLLLATPSGRQLGALSPLITRRPVWVRHDEHFHVDFAPATTPTLEPSTADEPPGSHHTSTPDGRSTAREALTSRPGRPRRTPSESRNGSSFLTNGRSDATSSLSEE